MLFLGITGGLATGKSLVTRELASRGAVTFSADEAARAILTPEGPDLREITRVFGSDILHPDGSLNRAALGMRVFASPEDRLRLMQITHPPILRLLRAQMNAVRDDFPRSTTIGVEVPLLFETGMETWFQRIVVVTAPEATQIARLSARNGLDTAQARQRLAAQWPLEVKVARASDVITNDGTREELAAQVAALWPIWQEEALCAL